MCKLPSVTITPLHLSDMFFNSDHLNHWKAADHSNGSFSDFHREALKNDAIAFINDLGIADQVTPEQLVEDFFARL